MDLSTRLFKSVLGSAAGADVSSIETFYYRTHTRSVKQFDANTRLTLALTRTRYAQVKLSPFPECTNLHLEEISRKIIHGFEILSSDKGILSNTLLRKARISDLESRGFFKDCIRGSAEYNKRFAAIDLDLPDYAGLISGLRNEFESGSRVELCSIEPDLDDSWMYIDQGEFEETTLDGIKQGFEDKDVDLDDADFEDPDSDESDEDEESTQQAREMAENVFKNFDGFLNSSSSIDGVDFERFDVFSYLEWMIQAMMNQFSSMSKNSFKS